MEYSKWIKIIGFNDYFVNNLGQIMSTKRNKRKILKQHTTKDGYKRITLMTSNSKEHKKLLVHRIVLLAFSNPNQVKKEVNHIDKDKANNKLTNLEWVTHRENKSHDYKTRIKSSQYTGVRLDSDKKVKYKKWVSTIRINGKSVYLGNFQVEKEAHEAYLEAMKTYGIENKYC